MITLSRDKHINSITGNACPPGNLQSWIPQGKHDIYAIGVQESQYAPVCCMITHSNITDAFSEHHLLHVKKIGSLPLRYLQIHIMGMWPLMVVCRVI